MKDDPRFKNWLKKKYSCSKCNSIIFSFIGKDIHGQEHIQVFYYHRSEIKPWTGFSFGGERICFDCYKKITDESEKYIGTCATDYVQKIYEIYQTERKELRKKPIPAAELKKVIEYAKQTDLEKCSKCQNYSFFISENKTQLTEKFHYVNDQNFCPNCFENLSESEKAGKAVYKIGYKDIYYSLYDLWEAWKNKDIVAEKSSYKFEEKANPNQKTTQTPVSPPQNPNLERKDKSKFNYWPVAFLVVCFFLSLIFLAIFAFSKSKRK